MRIAGIVDRVKQSKIKSGPNAGRMMGRFILEDLHGTIQVAVFADQMKTYGSQLSEEAVVLVSASCASGRPTSR